MYSIKELADLAGTTTRTLRYYDQKGLLVPARIGENGYRYYDHGNLLTLQQILFFRELDLPLKDIRYLLDRPDFQLRDSLQNHQQEIRKKITRYQVLLDTITKTLLDLEGESKMTEKEYFNGFDETKYQEEAQQKWGHTPQYKESQEKWSSYSADEKDRIKRLGGEITQRMVTHNPQAKPSDPKVQDAVREYYEYMNRYFYSFEFEFMRNLADMWVEDPRFAINYEGIREGGAEFVRQAVHIFCDNHKSDT